MSTRPAAAAGDEDDDGDEDDGAAAADDEGDEDDAGVALPGRPASPWRSSKMFSLSNRRCTSIVTTGESRCTFTLKICTSDLAPDRDIALRWACDCSVRIYTAQHSTA
jgi:hypothetical protein